MHSFTLPFPPVVGVHLPEAHYTGGRTVGNSGAAGAGRKAMGYAEGLAVATRVTDPLRARWPQAATRITDRRAAVTRRRLYGPGNCTWRQ